MSRRRYILAQSTTTKDWADRRRRSARARAPRAVRSHRIRIPIRAHGRGPPRGGVVVVLEPGAECGMPKARNAKRPCATAPGYGERCGRILRAGPHVSHPLLLGPPRKGRLCEVAVTLIAARQERPGVPPPQDFSQHKGPARVARRTRAWPRGRNWRKLALSPPTTCPDRCRRSPRPPDFSSHKGAVRWAIDARAGPGGKRLERKPARLGGMVLLVLLVWLIALGASAVLP